MEADRELPPCPKCGGKPSVSRRDTVLEGVTWHRIYCDPCGRGVGDWEAERAREKWRRTCTDWTKP
jgi:hypothetical protein